MHKNSFITGLAVGVFAAFIVVFAASAFNARRIWGDVTPPDAKVAEIVGLLERYSIIPFEREMLFNSMYRGLLDGVGDPYTQYFDAVALEAFTARTEGVFGGVGMSSIMCPDTRLLTISTVFRGLPAEEAGLLPGDMILRVNGEEMLGRPQAEVVALIRGPVDTPVRLELLRPYDGSTFEAVLIRTRVEVPTVSHEIFDCSTGFIRVDAFDRITLRQFNDAMAALADAGMTGLIIDVRNNPGGLMPTVVSIANQFVPEGTHITFTEHANGRREYHTATGAALDIPLAVLVNERSASASEILSAAIQDTGMGVIVGAQTFGKGIVQNLMYLSDGNAIKMTVAKYFTPNGTSIHGIGVTPCVYVAMEEHLARRIGTLPLEDDIQLQHALEIVDTIRSRIRR